MYRRRGIALTIAILAVVVTVLGSCESRESPTYSIDVDVWDWEAERAVLILGQDPSESPELVAIIAEDLARIRSRYDRTLDLDVFRVHFPWDPKALHVLLEPEGIALLRSGDWPAFEAIVAELEYDSVSWCGGATLHFSTMYNPCQLREKFQDLEYVMGVFPDWRVYRCNIRECGIIWPEMTERGMVYLFERLFEEHRTFDCFRADYVGPLEHVGAWDPASDEPEPEWWAELNPPYFHDMNCD